MARRTIEISAERAHLAIEHNQLLIIRDGQSRRDLEMRQRVACEDLGILVVDHREVTYTHAALATLADHGASLVVCSDDHLPAAIMLPISSHTEQIWRIQDQIDCSKVLKKQLWTKLVKAKIRAQAENLEPDTPAHRRLIQMVKEVKSDDTTNVEAQAARVYWQALFPPKGDFKFKRSPGQRKPPNAFLDYGYAILRAAIARALVGAGLMPAIGIHHSNRSNAFCLADDLIEPLRPMIDRRVREIVKSGSQYLDQQTKAQLLLTLTATVSIAPPGEEPTIGPLDAALVRYAASLARSYGSGQESLLIPIEVPPEDE
jgi:CRISP-associated protein Cas1